MKVSSEEQEESLKKTMTLMIFMAHGNNNDRQSDAENSDGSKDEGKVEDRMRVKVTLSGLNMGGFGIQLTCAHTKIP